MHVSKNDSMLQIEEIVRIYSNSKYLDRNVPWVLLFILAEYSYNKPPLGFVVIAQILKSKYRPSRTMFVYEIQVNPIHTILKYGDFYDFIVMYIPSYS